MIKKYLFALLFLWPYCSVTAQQCAVFSPSIDGCSDFGVDAANFKTDFAQACNNHDYCYRTIGLSKNRCDSDFKSDLRSSCDEKYLRYESYQKVDERCIAGIILGIPWVCAFTEDIYDWVETTAANAQRISQLPSYPECIVSAEGYYAAVNQSSIAADAYDKAQEQATNWARGLAKGHFEGSCSLSPANANLFDSDKGSVIDALYRNIAFRYPTDTEKANAISSSEGDINWQYTIINTIDGRVAKQNAVIVPIVMGLLF